MAGIMARHEERVDKEQDPRGRFHPDRLPFLPSLAATLFRLHHRTCKFTILGGEHEEFAKRCDGPALITSWHFAFPAVVYRYRDYNAVVMVSRSRDGEWVARAMENLGYRCFRGSPGKGGSTALKQLISHIKGTLGGGFLADGSQGPPRIAQKGILLLARYSGAPLLPVSMAARPCWRFRSWDRTVLAKPFSHVVMTIGPPMWIERDISSARLEHARLELERSLNRLTEEAEEALKIIGPPRSWPCCRRAPKS
jgi:lysophospholipid acyltransferase (LPLAT)-like uncharacterized protein